MKTAWEDIVGQNEPKRRLLRLLTADRLPHALLFTGPKGIGKCRTAEALAGALLCTNPENGRPCGGCASCRALARDIHPDFFRVEPEAVGKGARSIRIEPMRALMAALSQLPETAPRQVVILDDVDRMNEPAANSFLKTLEEPSGAVVFILVTSAQAALLDTIVSRCLEIPFAPLMDAELYEILRRHEIPEAARRDLAALAEGSAGRALALYAGGALERRAEVLRLLPRIPELSPLELLAEGKRLGELSREEAGDWLRFLRLALRDLLALYGGVLPSKGASLGLTALAERFLEARAFQMLAAATEAERRLYGSNANIRLLMEALLLRLRGPVEG